MGRRGVNGAPKITDHHNVPGSLGGSDESINLSRIEDGHHGDFHEWASNHLPCQLTRLLAIHAIGTEKPVEPDTLETVFQITTLKNWTKLYDRDAMHLVSEPTGLKHACKAAENNADHLLVELSDIRRTLQALTNGGVFPVKNSLVLPKALDFFGVETALDALRELHSEVDDEGNLAWVKPMQEVTRQSIDDALNGRVKKRRLQKQRKAFIQILRKQQKIVEEHYEHWKDALSKHAKKKHHD